MITLIPGEVTLAQLEQIWRGNDAIALHSDTKAPIEAAAAYRVAAEQAAPPLVELLAAYELRVAELASGSHPPRSPGPGTSAAGPPVGAD